MKTGFIGTGLLGLPMAQKLIEQGVSLTAYNRTAEKLGPLEAAGAVIARTPGEVISSCDAIILMLSDAAAISQVLAGRPALPGRSIIQMGTIAPKESRAFLQEIKKDGGDYLEAPVLGSIPQARDASLVVMVGSTKEQYDRFRPLLSKLGPNPRYVGEVGKAAALKLALNQLIASLTAAFSQSLGLVRRSGLDVDQFMTILRKSALYAPTFDKKLGKMLERNFENPNFPTQHLLKDINLFIDEAKDLGLNPASAEGVREIISAALAAGHSDLDYSSLYLAVDP